MNKTHEGRHRFRFRRAELKEDLCCADCPRRPPYLAACRNDPDRGGQEGRRQKT